jgi:hypothetical protein
MIVYHTLFSKFPVAATRKYTRLRPPLPPLAHPHFC